MAPDDPRALVGVVHRALHEELQRRVLLLDHEHLGEAVGEVAHLLLVDGHRHEEVEETDAGGAQGIVVAEAEQAERLAQLVIGVAAGGDADPVVLGRHGDLVEAVGDAVATGELGADLLELPLHVERVRREQAPARMGDEDLAVELHRRDHRLDAVGVHVDGAGAVGDRRDELHADPDPAGPRQGDGVAAEVERLLHVTGEEDRHVQVDERGVARARQGRRLGGRVVADDRHHATVPCRAGEHAVADRVTGSVEPRRLAVPHADDAVVALVVERVDELAAHHRRRRQLLVEAGTDDDRQVRHGGRGGGRLLLERRRRASPDTRRRTPPCSGRGGGRCAAGRRASGRGPGRRRGRRGHPRGGSGRAARTRKGPGGRSPASSGRPSRRELGRGAARSMVMAPLVIRPVCRRPSGVACARSPRSPRSR